MVQTIITDELVSLVADMLAARWRKGQVKQAIREINGGPCARATYEKIINAGRALLRERLGLDTADHKSQAVGFYETIIRDESLPVESRLRAQKQLERLLGIGGSFELASASPEEQAARVRSALRRMTEASVVESDNELDHEEAEDAEV